jgi:hypothetical protein
VCTHARASQTMHTHTQLPDLRGEHERGHALSHTRGPPACPEEDNTAELRKACSSLGGIPFDRSTFVENFPSNIKVNVTDPGVMDTWQLKYLNRADMPRSTDHWFMSSSESTAFFMQSKAHDTPAHEMISSSSN